MGNKEKLYLVMPAYNEEETIEEVVKEWYKVLKFGNEESKIIVADSGSTDSTHKKLLELQKEYPQLEIVSDSEKQHGPKLIYLYGYSIKNKADWIFQTDSDGQTNPEEFEEFWNNRDEYDVILGDRQVREDGKVRDFIEKVVCLLLKIYFKVKVPDANAPFRLMKASVVEKYLENFSSDYNLPNIMLTTYFVYYKEKFLFKEITFKPRQGGINSINVSKIFKIGLKALSDFKKLKDKMKKSGNEN